ncbi:hypothetical protein GCM10009642_17610 [Nocardiopsis metallicus]|uniref:Cell wall-associated NlpC family hydrolase n=1 Tax=Nocardiopsis metallicus TaxID=179819 RepID=A0A840WC28_9ACTN|nr:C40 family peptidase [Nocardiopsis metallicus]MBB5494549.1 cell wall-associated NlpC family hydrolase [Nocardiopsis metallicus]
MVEVQRGQPRAHLIRGGEPVGPQPGDGGVDVERVPPHHGVEHQPQGTELVLQPLAVALLECAAVAEADLAVQLVAGVGDVELGATSCAGRAHSSSRVWGHNGLYVGNGMMVYAPSSGKTVSEVRLADYWAQHFVGARPP